MTISASVLKVQKSNKENNSLLHATYIHMYRVFKQQPVDFTEPYLWTPWMKLLIFFLFAELLRLVHLWPVHFLYRNPSVITIAVHQICTVFAW